MVFLTNLKIEQQCEICRSLILIGDERCIVHHTEQDMLSCILCGAAAEKLGWGISV